MTQQIEFGLDTFGDVTVGLDGTPVSHAQVIRNVVARACSPTRSASTSSASASTTAPTSPSPRPRPCSPAIADAHRAHPAGLGRDGAQLATTRSACSSASPRVDALSNGRAEVILGRGSFTESFPLFGYDLARLRAAVRGEARPVPAAAHRAARHVGGHHPRRRSTDQRVYPTTEGGHLRTWIGVGGSPESVVRAARYGMPLVLAIIGGDPARFAPFVDLYHRALAELGQPDAADRRALARLHRRHRRGGASSSAGRTTSVMRDRIGAERGWPPSTRGRVPPGGRARIALRRLARDRRPQDRDDDPHPRHPALRPQVQRRHPAARAHDARDRALRSDRRADGEGHSRRRLSRREAVGSRPGGLVGATPRSEGHEIACAPCAATA